MSPQLSLSNMFKSFMVFMTWSKPFMGECGGYRKTGCILMEYVKLGPSGVKVSMFCTGIWHLHRLKELGSYGVPKIDVDEFKKIFKHKNLFG